VCAAEDALAPEQLCCWIVALKHGLSPEEIKVLIKAEDTSVESHLIIPPHCRIDPSAIQACLIDFE
jgi:hypothetical protein